MGPLRKARDTMWTAEAKAPLWIPRTGSAECKYVDLSNQWASVWADPPVVGELEGCGVGDGACRERGLFQPSGVSQRLLFPHG